MRKNLVLFLGLVGLITFIYYYFEVGEKKRELEAKSRSKINLIKVEELASLKFSDYTLILEKNQWIIEKHKIPVDHEFISQLYQQIENIQIVDRISKRVLKKNKRSFFFTDKTPSVSFLKPQGASVVLTLGNYIPTTGRFYLEVNKEGEQQVYVCRSVFEKEGFFKSELDYEASKYADIKSFFRASLKMLINKDLFMVQSIPRYLEEVSWLKKDAKLFTILPESKKTIPPIIQGLGYDSFEFERLIRKIRQTQVLDLVQKNPKKWKYQRTMILKVEGKSWNLKLYTYRKKYYLVTQDGFTFQISQQSANYFFSNVQDYWNRQILTSDRPESLKGQEIEILRGEVSLLNLVFRQQENSDLLYITTLEDSHKESLKKWESSLLELIGLIVSQEKQDYPSYIKKWSLVKDLYEEAEENYFMQFLSKQFMFVEEKGEFLIVDQEKDIAFYFPYKRVQSWWPQLKQFFTSLQGGE